ncbi:MAG TPA: hypothetical protein VGG30_09230 [Pirellulales bacterium]|jgi:hypothetical protein
MASRPPAPTAEAQPPVRNPQLGNSPARDLQASAGNRQSLAAQASNQHPSGPKASGSQSTAARPDVNLLVASAVTAAGAQPAVSAKIRQRINLYGQQLVGTGAYWQQGKGDARRYRLEIKVQVADGLTSVEQVCTGAVLWVHEDLHDRSALTSIDLPRVREALHRQSSARATPAFALELPIGGLPNLLENLQAAFQFGNVEEKKLDQLSVYRLEGQWKPAALAELLADQRDKLLAGQAADWKKVPEAIPQRVVLTLGQDDLFPYRIEYLREQPGKQGAPATMLPILVIELFEVQLAVPVDPQRFVYEPGNRAGEIDGTAAYLKKLGIEETPPPDARRPAPTPTGDAVRR